MRISTIRNVLIKQTAIALALVGVFIGIVLYVDSFNEECDRKINQLKAESDGIIRQVAELSSNYNKVISDMSIYNDIKKKEDNKMLMVSKVALRDAIAGARNKYYLDGLDVKMEAIKQPIGDKYKKNTSFIESSDTTINLNALSDLDILGLVKTLDTSFLGIKYTSLKLSLPKDLDNAALISIKDTGFAPIVTGKLTFTLLGLRNVNGPDNDLNDESKGVLDTDVDADGKKRIRLRLP